MPDDDEVLTVKEAAAYLKLHPKTVYRLVKEGQIPAQRVGGAWRLYRARLRDWLQTSGQAQENAADSGPAVATTHESGEANGPA